MSTKKTNNLEAYVTLFVEELNEAIQKSDNIDELDELDKEPLPLTNESIIDNALAIIEEEERYASGKNIKIIGEIVGFIPEQFPPSEKLTAGQMKRIADAYEALLLSHEIDPDFPEKLPTKLRYEILSQTLAMEINLRENENTVIELCNYEPLWCPFGYKYCQCKIADEESLQNNKNGNNEEMANDDLPF